MTTVEAHQAVLSQELQELQRAAEEARARSYAPYSRFTVGAALRCADGTIITAGNVENASYGLTICAERAAIFRALAMGFRDFAAIAVAGPAATVSPCGACRQVLAEFMVPDALVVFPVDGALAATPLGVLLPHAFVPDNVLSGS
jgi:cytidine deaminase